MTPPADTSSNGRMAGKCHSEQTKKKLSSIKKAQYKGEGNPMYGRRHSSVSRHKMSEHAKQRCFVSRAGQEKRVLKTDLDTYLNEGWSRGRISMRGHIWINKEGVAKRIFRGQLNSYLSLGWSRGRKGT